MSKLKLKKRRFNTDALKILKSLNSSLSVGHPKEARQTHETDRNGHSVLFKAYELNYGKGYKPYLKISFEKNSPKYRAMFKAIAKNPKRTTKKSLKNIGNEMVQDIRATLRSTQLSPVGTTTGRLYGAVTFRIKND